ncbi:MAG: hypothetical protein MUE73_18310 [Planctomycetes bacterium]|nr:hypothetical protein [Planctomycetota bacterium]
MAALIPLSELRRLTAARPRFAEAVSDFRASLSPADLEAIGKAFVIPRERSPGREVELYYTPPKSPRGSQISRERAPQAPAAAGGEAGEAALAADAGEDLPPPLDRQRGRARRDWAAGVPAL